MLGSTFIAEPNQSRLAGIESAEDLDAFLHVDLDRMTTIDFAKVLAAKKVKWTDGKPVRYNEQEGLALFKVAEAALKHVLRHTADFPKDCQADLKKLAAFVKQNGASDIYELATF